MDLDVLDLLAQVGGAGQDIVRVLLQQLRGKWPACDHSVLARVDLERAHRGNDHGRVRREARGAAFDVEEALGAHVSAESRLGDQEVSAVDADQVREHRRRAVGDVAERSGVDQHRRVLQRLQQVGLDRVAHDHRHGAARVQEVGGDRLAIAREADDHPAQPPSHVLQRCGKGEHGHHLGRRGDVESGLACDAVLRRAEPDDHAAQDAVADVEHPAPGDAVKVDRKVAQAVVDVVVDHRGQEVVRRGDRVEVACEVQVEPLHRDHLAIAAAGRAALDPERGPHRRLADRDGRPLPDQTERIAQADRRRRLAFAERCGRDSGDDDVLRARLAAQLLDRVELDLRDIVPIGLEQVRVDAHLARDLGHRQQSRFARDLEVGRKLNLHPPSPIGFPRASRGATSRSARSR